MSKQDFDRHLQQRLADLPKEQQPERDLWAGIELALGKEQSEPEVSKHAGFKLFSVAATFAVMGVVGWLTMNQPQDVSADQIVVQLSAQHEEQKQSLLVKFQDQPALTQNWQTQLQELDEAADAIKKALRQDPNNMALLKMLQKVYQQQISLIEKVHATKWQKI